MAKKKAKLSPEKSCEKEFKKLKIASLAACLRFGRAQKEKRIKPTPKNKLLTMPNLRSGSQGASKILSK